MLIPNDFHALVIGATGALGSAFSKHLQLDPRCQSLTELSRKSHPGFELGSPDAFADIAQSLKPPDALSLVVDASGALSFLGRGPEKSLRALEPAQLRLAMDVNAIGPILLIRALMPLLKQRGPMLYIKLSARVGSISDNQKGGWYGYRASKAALNMMLQCTALEWQRTNPQAQVIALQPGTVRSRLSMDFVQSMPKVLSADESVQNSLLALEKLQAQAGAQFIDFRGESIPW